MQACILLKIWPDILHCYTFMDKKFEKIQIIKMWFFEIQNKVCCCTRAQKSIFVYSTPLCPLHVILREAVICCFPSFFGAGGDEYESWIEYREFYSTLETDRDYLLYWKTIVKDLKVCMVQLSAAPSLKLCSVFSLLCFCFWN